MDSGLKELAVYRFLRAKEMLDAAEQNFEMGQLRTSLNRSYYAVFHAMRAVNILEGFDSSKHSSDYDDFYITSRQETKEQLDNAKNFLDEVEGYLCSKKII